MICHCLPGPYSAPLPREERGRAAVFRAVRCVCLSVPTETQRWDQPPLARKESRAGSLGETSDASSIGAGQSTSPLAPSLTPFPSAPHRLDGKPALLPMPAQGSAERLLPSRLAVETESPALPSPAPCLSVQQPSCPSKQFFLFQVSFMGPGLMEHSLAPISCCLVPLNFKLP